MTEVWSLTDAGPVAGEVAGAAAVLRGVHARAVCAPYRCWLHAPSPHRLSRAPVVIRTDWWFLVERICPHGLGHPDPDDIAYHHRSGRVGIESHSCDGCCSSEAGLDLTMLPPAVSSEWATQNLLDEDRGE